MRPSYQTLCNAHTLCHEVPIIVGSRYDTNLSTLHIYCIFYERPLFKISYESNDLVIQFLFPSKPLNHSSHSSIPFTPSGVDGTYIMCLRNDYGAENVEAKAYLTFRCGRIDVRPLLHHLSFLHNSTTKYIFISFVFFITMVLFARHTTYVVFYTFCFLLDYLISRICNRFGVHMP